MSLGLAMIVRNEAKVIRRALMSVKDHISYWTIIDTGSGDGTKQLILDTMGDIPGQLLERPWVDFGFNRTELLQEAKDHTDFILCMDADMTLVGVGDPPQCDANLVRYTGEPDYAQALLIRGDRDWHYEGRTHEYLASDELYTQGPALHWLMQHHADGGERGRKFQRDRELLQLEVDEDPTNGRALFYLAQTLRDLGETDLAITRYRQRVALGGWDQEVWFAQFQVGLLAWDFDELATAFSMRETRAEPLLYMAQIMAEKGEHHAALALLDKGLAIPYPNDNLFIEKWIYTWGLSLERTAQLWQCGDKEMFKLETMRLLADIPPHIVERLDENLREYG